MRRQNWATRPARIFRRNGEMKLTCAMPNMPSEGRGGLNGAGTSRALIRIPSICKNSRLETPRSAHGW